MTILPTFNTKLNKLDNRITLNRANNMNFELWFTEKHTKNVHFSLKVKEHLYHAKSDFQTIDVIDTYEFGRILVLDGAVMLSDRDESAYHEMLVHVAAFTHPNPTRALVIGGGDGGTVRELLKHDSIESIDLVEIDNLVVDISRKYFPQLSGGFDNPRTHIHYQDGIEFVKNVKDKYDLVLVDSIDPVGPAVGLFEKPFYENVFHCLKDDGILSVQAESSLYNAHVSVEIAARLKELFPLVKPYLTFIPTYPSGQWVFVTASKKYDPLQPSRLGDIPRMESELKYYNADIHQAAFALTMELRRKYGG